MANPETLLGEIEAKTRELIGTESYAQMIIVLWHNFIMQIHSMSLVSAKRTTPLLEYIKNKKIEKQVRKQSKWKKWPANCFDIFLILFLLLYRVENKRGEERGEEEKRARKEKAKGGGEEKAARGGET